MSQEDTPEEIMALLVYSSLVIPFSKAGLRVTVDQDTEGVLLIEDQRSNDEYHVQITRFHNPDDGKERQKPWVLEEHSLTSIGMEGVEVLDTPMPINDFEVGLVGFDVGDGHGVTGIRAVGFTFQGPRGKTNPVILDALTFQSFQANVHAAWEALLEENRAIREQNDE